MAAVVRLVKQHRGRDSIVEKPTLEELTQYFRYTLECGASYNKRIQQHPKTLRSLISNINKAYEETQGSCYQQDSVRAYVPGEVCE